MSIKRTTDREPVKSSIKFRKDGDRTPGNRATAELFLVDGKPKRIRLGIPNGISGSTPADIPIRDLDCIVGILQAVQEELAEGRHD